MKLAPADAMEMAGITRQVWDDGLRHGTYDQAPPTTQGVPRQFDRDDILAMSVQAQLVTLGLSKAAGWKIAGAVRVALRDGAEDIERLWITGRGVDTKRPAGVATLEIPVAELRQKIAALVANRLARGARN